MKPPGPIALRAAADALANVGVQEVGENAGKAVETYLASVGLSAGAPWCAAFVHLREQKAAGELKQTWPQMGFPRSGYVPDFVNWAKARGLWIPVGQAKGVIAKGDLLAFYFAAKGRCAHIGMVVEPHEWGVLSVEGNTSSSVGVDREGDGVFEKRRLWSSLGLYGGFIRVPF